MTASVATANERISPIEELWSAADPAQRALYLDELAEIARYVAPLVDDHVAGADWMARRVQRVARHIRSTVH